MRFEKQHIDFIRKSFSNMKDRKDLLDLLNYVKPIIYGPKTKPFELKQLTWYVIADNHTKRYSQFSIPKKSGGERIIQAPVKGLKVIQTCLTQVMQIIFTPHPSAFGFVNGKSIVDNAAKHIAAKYIYNIDLENFFPSIEQARFWKCLQLPPFRLINRVELDSISESKSITFDFVSFNRNKTKNIIILDYKNLSLPKGEYQVIFGLDSIFCRIFPELSSLGSRGSIELNLKESWISEFNISELFNIMTDSHLVYFNNLFEEFNKSQNKIIKRIDIANLIASLCFAPLMRENDDSSSGVKNILPQGAPTSPVITNIICQKLDFLLSAVAKRFGLVYSRYADDITFSSPHNVYQKGSEFLLEIERIIRNQGFIINQKKVRLQKEGYRQEVTGLVISNRVNVQKRFIKELRMWIYFLERYGVEKTNQIFSLQYAKVGANSIKPVPPLLSVLRGKIDFLYMVKGKSSLVCSNLDRRLKMIEGVRFDQGPKPSYLDTTIDLIFTKGLDVAMNYYNSQRND